MEENKNLSSNDELVDDSMGAVAGGIKPKGKEGKNTVVNGWTAEQLQQLRMGYCQNFDDPDEKFKEITTKYTYAKFQEQFKKAWGGFKF